MKRHGFFLSILFMASAMGLLSFSVPKNEGFVDLSGTWKLKGFPVGEGIAKKVYLPDYDLKNSLSAEVPGTVRQALLKAGKISDPYYGYNNEKSLWVEAKEWWFFKDFKAGSELKGKTVSLRFNGTVFKGDVWLNGKKIGTLKGMFNPRSFEITHLLNFDGTNRIAVRLEAPLDATRNKKIRGLSFDVKRDQLHSIAQSYYGWDWAPHMVPIGIWQPVWLKYSGAVILEHPYILSSIISGKPAKLSIKYEIKNTDKKPRRVIVKGFIHEKGKTRVDNSFKQEMDLPAGAKQTMSTTVEIPNPKLWWPNGMGDQPLYILKLTALTNGRVSDKIMTQFGIRELKLVNNEQVKKSLKGMTQWRIGKVTQAYPWTFQINGKKMFAKGASWIPISSMLKLDKGKYEHLLKLAKEAHFNMLRVWGGGLYETDEFYNLADEYGILIWQGFLSNRNFSKIDRENFIKGAIATIYRIRNHPSLALWVGGNEFNPDDLGSKAIIDTLEKVLKEIDPSREFHRASPYMGDDHEWLVWHGLAPYTSYRRVRPFRSEAGINTFPVIENYKKFTPKKYLWPLNKTYLEYHGERNPSFTFLSKLERYANEFGVSSSLGEFIMKSQLYQALADKFDMEFSRENKFRNSGLLIWQYDDSWPTLSWSLVDWYGTPKPSYYYLKRASQPLAISADYKTYLWEAGDTLSSDIYILNDNYEVYESLTYRTVLYNIEGKLLTEKSGMVSVGANKSVKAGTLQWHIPDSYKGKTLLLSVQLLNKKGKIISEGIYPLAVSKQHVKTLQEEKVKKWEGLVDYYKKYYTGIFDELNNLPQTDLQTDLSENTVSLDEKGKGELHIKLSNPSDNIAFFISIRLKDDLDKLYAFYSDNYFSLLPGESKDFIVHISDRGIKRKDVSSAFVISGWNISTEEIPIKIKVR